VKATHFCCEGWSGDGKLVGGCRGG
jgi:hypothetical protein